VKVLLDTDPGSDIDDAIALAYLARHPDCELLGVTTVTGDVRKRAAIIEVVLRAFGREGVPIAAGARDVLLYGPGQPEVPHYEFIADLPHRLDRPEYAAVDFLREKIKENPGDVTLLTIGPLTNAATLLLMDPEIVGSIKQVVSMAGWFHFAQQGSEQGTEWNAECDPLASAIFFQRCTCPLTVVPLDVTLQCRLKEQEFRAKFADAPKDVILRMTKKWFEGCDAVTFHDPLACALIFKPELCTYRTGRVEATNDKGYTKVGGTGNARVAETVEVAAFFEEYFRVVG
jgi:purine nucleosidase